MSFGFMRRLLLRFLPRQKRLFRLAAFLLFVSVPMLLFKLGGWALAFALASFVLIALHVALDILESTRRAFPHRITPKIYSAMFAFLITFALAVIAREGFIEIKGGIPPPLPEEQMLEQQFPQEALVQFAGNFLLAKRLGADTEKPPLLRAQVDGPASQDIPFTVPETWDYQLALQMTDSPYIDHVQDESDYLTFVFQEQAIMQTFRVSERARTLEAVRVFAEARSIINNLAATSEPDAPLTATLYTFSATGELQKLGQYAVPPEKAALNDKWQWTTLPFQVDLSKTRGKTFAVEFASSSSIIGWALANATKGFQGRDDFYKDGEMFINRTPYDPGADLKFEVLVRNEQDESPIITVDGTAMLFEQVENESDWLLSNVIALNEGNHTLSVSSSNPHVSFYKFVFIQAEVVRESEEKQDVGKIEKKAEEESGESPEESKTDESPIPET